MTTDAAAPPISPPAAAPPVTGGGSLIRRYAMLGGATIAGQLIGMVVLAIVARRIGPQYLGSYTFAASVVLYFTLPLMPGITTLAIRDYAATDTDPKGLISEVSALMLGNALIAYGLLVLLAGLLAPDPVARDLLPIAGLVLIVNAVSLDWTLQGMQNARALSAWRLAGQVVYGIVTPLVVGTGLAGVEAYAWCNIVGYAVTAAGAITWVWRAHGSPFRRISFRPMAARVRRSLPFGISLVMVQIYVSLDFLLLGYLSTSSAVGQYAAAAKLPLAITGLASIWVVILYPHAAGLFTRDREALRRQVSRFTGLGILVALPLVPVGFLMGEQIVTAVFGSAFAPAAAPFAVLLCSAGVVIVNSNIGNLLLACNDEKSFLLAVTAGAAINLGLNFLLIPPLGPEGSAIATIAAEGFVLGSMAWRFQRVVGPITLEWRRIASGVAGAAALAVALVALSEDAALWLQIVVATVVYPLVLVVTRGVTRDDLVALRSRP